MKKRKRTDKSKYKHESTGDYCTCAAFVAEIMCKRNAENRNEGSLPYKFWNRKPWDWTFKRQLFLANQLIKEFGEAPLVRAVESNDFRKIFSLNHPSVKQTVKKYQSAIELEKKNVQELEYNTQASHRKKTYSTKKNILQKLRDIENGKEEDE